jgi:uncharacterized membrane protein
MKKILNFISKTSSGLATGLFATLIIGTILKQIFTLINFQIGIDIAITLMNLIGIGIALPAALPTQPNPRSTIGFEKKSEPE